MRPNFDRTEQAFKLTLEYYNITRIKGEIARLVNGETADTKVRISLLWYAMVLRSHEKMEEEINQVINTNTYNTVVHYFEDLKERLSDTKIKNIDTNYFINVINDHNQKVNNELILRVQKEVEKLHQSVEFSKYNHLEEYEKEVKLNTHSISGITSHSIRTKVNNYKYYCINENIDFIDLDFLDAYINLLSTIISNLKRICTKYVSRYDAGKILPNHQFILETRSLPLPSQSIELPPIPIEQIPKLKWNDTPKEFVFYFAPLITDRKIILKSVHKSDTDPIVKILHSYFEIHKNTGKGEITVQTLQTYFKEFNTKDYSKSIKKSKK